MLLKSPNKTKLGTTLLVVLVCTLLTFQVIGQNLSQQDWQVHGFLAQGVINVDGSDFVNDDKTLSAELTEVGINGSFQSFDNLRFTGQAVYLNGGNRYTNGLRVDYLLADWSFITNEKWQANLYLGRFKNYHWLYSSTRDVPMTRPSIVLPQSVYFDGTRDMSVGGDGAALSVKYFSESWGDFDFNISSGVSPISAEQTDLIMGRYSKGDLEHNEDLQASIYWQPSFSNWRFGIAVTDAEFTYEKKGQSFFSDGTINLNRLYANGEYQADNWTVSLELLQETMELNGVLYSSFERKTTGQGGFVQGEYQLNSQVKLLGRYEHYFSNKDDQHGRKLNKDSYGLVPNYFGYQHDAVFGITYSLLSNLQLQFEHHWIKGTARLTPVILPDPSVNDNKYWQITAAQLIYWF